MKRFTRKAFRTFGLLIVLIVSMIALAVLEAVQFFLPPPEPDDGSRRLNQWRGYE